MISEIFDLRLRLFAVGSTMAVVNEIIADIFDVAGKAGTLSMQGLMIACIVALGGVIVWQNKGREALNKERHEENRKFNADLMGKLTAQQAAIDAERIARIGKLMEQQKEDIEAKKELAFAQRELAQSITKNNHVIGELERVVHKLVDHLELRERQS